MKKLTFLNLFLTGIVLSAFGQHPTIGGYNVYYGNLHNHTTVSDGAGSPSQAFNTAKSNGLDFFGIGDHDYSITSSEYTLMKNTANSYNQDGVFTTFYGFEWSSNGEYGHILVVNANDYCQAFSSTTNTFDKLRGWMSSRECIAFFNHPGRENWSGREFDHFTDAPDNKFVGIELWNKTDGFNSYYYNDGYYPNDGNRSYWDEALIRNWKLGASGAEDHHSVYWGAGNYSMAILANSLTRSSLYNAMKARRFYSTMDKTIVLSFKLNGNEMGSTIEGGTLNLLVQAYDTDNETFTKVMLYKNGVANQTWNTNTTTVAQTATIIASDGDFYYVKVTQQDGVEAISSPIWIVGNVPPPTVTARINSGINDVEEGPSGYMYTNSTDLELTYDGYQGGNQVIGMRFTNLNIPQGSTIHDAYIQFTCDETSFGTCNLRISGHDADNSPVFTTSLYDVSGRTKTSTKINWLPPSWQVPGESNSDQRTPDISTVVQEIVDRPGYSSTSAISIIIDGTGYRLAESYEGSPASAPLLCINYTEPVTTIEVTQQISSSMDDVEEVPGGYIYPTSSDIELTNDPDQGGYQIIGLRFTNMNIPQGATISSAFMQFTCDEPSTGGCNLYISGHNSDNSPVFTTTQYNVSGRTKTSATINWLPPSWHVAGESTNEHRTPDIKTVVQEIVDRPGYTSASSITLIIDGTGNRVAESYDGVPNSAAKLTVTYQFNNANKSAITGNTYNGIDDESIYSSQSDTKTNYLSGSALDQFSDNIHETDNTLNVVLFPNPVNDQLTYIKVNKITEDMHLRLLDISGKTLINKSIENSITELQVANIEPGLYFIEVSGGSELVIRKLIVN